MMNDELNSVLLRSSSFITHRFIYQAPDAVQSRGCKPRQAGNGATVAVLGCAAASPEPDQTRARGNCHSDNVINRLTS